MDELHRGLIAVQLIQELIVDKCAEYGLFTREEFEKELTKRVTELNKKLEDMKKEEEMLEKKSTNPFYYFNPAPGEA